MIETIAGVGLICIGISIVYLIKSRNSKEDKGEYIWVGPGKDPFK